MKLLEMASSIFPHFAQRSTENIGKMLLIVLLLMSWNIQLSLFCPKFAQKIIMTHATRALLPWEISCIMRFLNGICFSLYFLSPMRWPLNQTLEKFGVIAIWKFLLENLLNPDILVKYSLFSSPVDDLNSWIIFVQGQPFIINDQGLPWRSVIEIIL